MDTTVAQPAGMKYVVASVKSLVSARVASSTVPKLVAAAVEGRWI